MFVGFSSFPLTLNFVALLIECILTRDSGTTGMPKGVPFNVDRGFYVGCAVSYLGGFPCSFRLT